MNELEVAERRRRWNGRHVVVGMLLFGITMVAALWLYWEFYTRPFRALQNAIHAEFPDSTPRVIGGRPKSHRADSPSTLRIIARVYFDPETEVSHSEEVAHRLAELAREYHDVSQYELLEIHLEQRVPEKETRHWSAKRPIADWAVMPAAKAEK